jgi:hypothetical protein
MFCCVHTDRWTADTGYIGNENQDEEIEVLNHELKNLLATEVEAIIAKIANHKKLMDVIKQSVLGELTISINAESVDKATETV